MPFGSVLFTDIAGGKNVYGNVRFSDPKARVGAENNIIANISGLRKASARIGRNLGLGPSIACIFKIRLIDQMLVYYHALLV